MCVAIDHLGHYPTLHAHSCRVLGVKVACVLAQCRLPSLQEIPVYPGEQSQSPVLGLHSPLTQGGWHTSGVVCVQHVKHMHTLLSI